MQPDDQRSASIFRLKDGRALAYQCFGDASGFPTFYFHGTPSSRLEAGFADAAALDHGLRLIAIDRPGFGQSDFLPGRKFIDWPDDVIALADYLGVGAFGVAGHSGAGPHLFACGAMISPERLKFIGALGPWGPIATADTANSLNALDRSYMAIARQLPWTMHAAFAPIGWAALYWPDLFFGIMKANVSAADKAMLEQPEILHIFRQTEKEAFRQGSRGPAHEALIAYQDWGFDITDVRVPTYIWLGDEDIFVPQSMGRYLAQHIPNAELHMVPGKGHLNIENWHDIFAACAQHIATP
ncbi:alpha/beta fold hydrolase [Alterisphingorhabdus coralli]|uniref:Alpha/beta hydrolase n=1 Tax=Alterisphingorhabdus coralli TaxID=3071408 RepID=A0AA97F7M7_9SPHN|nr:alpha/beta hydrolase [Parasphingorhabdus sp. SCSIO 66989]WOE74020.1 alpha/beta hydrolase [Parasphingorhabdus sp. SCSIO 66989]